MTWPLIERELSVALRKQQTRRVRNWGTVICVAVTTLFLLFGAASGTSDWGKELNRLLFWGGLFIILQVPGYTVGIFAEERRNQTLGLLFLCGLGPWELFTSKTLGSALVSLSTLAILYPFFAISFFGGGVTWQWFLGAMCGLPVLLLFVFAICIIASVLCREESTALVVAFALAGVLCLTTPLLHVFSKAFSDGGPPGQDWLWLSPARPAYLLARNLAGGTIRELWISMAASVVWSVLALAAAGIVLNRVWQDKPDTETPSWRAGLRDWLRGDAAWRRRVAGRWIEVNPFAWLAARDRWATSLAWIVIGAVLLLWFAGWASWPVRWPNLANFFTTAVLLNASTNWLVLYAAAKRIGEDRRSGALELLLTSPLSEADIVRGQLEALRLQFRPVCFTLVALQVTMMLAGFFLRDWNAPAVGVYLLVWGILIYWAGRLGGSFQFALRTIWDSLNCGRPAYAAWRASGLTASPYYLAWLLYNLVRGLKRSSGLNTFPTGSIVEVGVVSILVLVFGLVWRARRLERPDFERRLLFEFRSVAQEPVPEPSDPRFKKWQPGERFPVQDPLGEHLIRKTLQRVSSD